MSTLKLMEWNMEWLNDLFVSDKEPVAFRPNDEKPVHASNCTIGDRRKHLSGVIDELAPDILVVIEGPSRCDELQLFFDTDVAGKWKVDLQASKGQTQNIGIAVRTDTGKFSDEPFKKWDSVLNKIFDPFLDDTDSDGVEEQHHFERYPLYVELLPKDAHPFRIFGLHLKSKGIFEAYEWSKWWVMADANRKKLLAQANHLRTKFLDPYLKNDETKNIPLIVCGDMNDGPGMDACEKKLFGSAIERLMGRIWNPELCLGNALFDSLDTKNKENLNFKSLYTTRFKDPVFDNYQKEWIDHILYTRNQANAWVTNGQIHEKMPDGSLIWNKYPHASDHYPISVEIRL